MTLFNERHDREPFLAQRSVGDGPGVVLVAVADTPVALRALSYGAGLARRAGSMLALVHVCREPLPTFYGAAEICVEQFVTSQREGLFLLERLADQLLNEQGVQAWITLRVGSPASEITSVAGQLHADAVVVGRTRSFRHRILGGVSRQLARHASWPVTVVP